MNIIDTIKNLYTGPSTTNILSYQDIIDNRNRFRGSLRDRADYNQFDEPRNVYFKIFFYFNNDNNNGMSSNLLGLELNPGSVLLNDLPGIPVPTEYDAPPHATDSPGLSNRVNWGGTKTNNIVFNTAYNFLVNNGEYVRADYLKQFIYLLSEINANSPWYWQDISGLDDAIDRNFFKDGKAKTDKQSINIKCLSDSYDERIGTLLSLYRAACFSWQNKKEIVPANLRKFDMGIYVYSAPISNMHGRYKRKYAELNGNPTNNDGSPYITSSKYFEFHNCEIDYNSTKSAFSSMSSIESKPLIYDFVINYDDCFETHYNEFMMKSIGDMVLLDTFPTEDKVKSTNATIENILSSRINMYKDKGFLDNALNQGIDMGKDFLTSNINKIVFGNAHKFSLLQYSSLADSILGGNIIGGIDTIKRNIHQEENDIKNKPSGNAYNNNIKPGDNAYDTTQESTKKAIEKVRTLGNAYKSTQLLNNL